MSATPRRVDYFANQEDMQTALLGSLGFGTEYIRQQTGLSHCQVLYRLSKADIKRAYYRSGKSHVAHTVFAAVNETVKKNIANQLRKAMGLDVKNGQSARRAG